MMDRERMIEREERREMEDREWRERERRSNTRWRIIELIVFGLLVAAATVVGAFIERSGG